MGSNTTQEIEANFKFNSENRLQELKAFDETKAGVKGLVDK
ncbi:1-aminocyclopropane-1-carboxylate oxidase-like protein, partial [Trifolium medium]|nr:1-aminocyclopropane-1-carboxylate oxidase-like protein [Trifolium medium]